MITKMKWKVTLIRFYTPNLYTPLSTPIIFDTYYEAQNYGLANTIKDVSYCIQSV